MQQFGTSMFHTVVRWQIWKGAKWVHFA